MEPQLLPHPDLGSRWSFSTSVALHLVIGAVVLGGSYLVIEAVQDPRTPIVFDFAAPSPPSPPPPPPAGSASPVPPTEQRMEQPPEQTVQPDVLPQDLLIAPDRLPSDGVADGQIDGVPDGMIGGVRDGVLHGVLGRPPGGEVGGRGDPAPIVPTPDMTVPVLVSKVEPEYPEVPRLARVPGKVILQAVIEADGDVADVTVLQSSNHLFEDSAIEAVRQWKYKPALQNGRPVPVYFTVVVEFALY